jgi:hypothetical protein
MTHPDPATSLSSSPRLNRWLLGTAAVGSAAAAQAEIVQIDLVGNQASVDGPNFVNNTYADFTGDGVDEFTSSSFYFGTRVEGTFGLRGNIGGNNVGALARSTTSSTTSSTFTSTTFLAYVGSNTSTSVGSPRSARGFIPVSFTDARINGGARTNALVEVRAANLDFDSHVVEIVRLVFDDANPAGPSGADLDTQYRLWGNIADSFPVASTKSKLAKKIAALEKQIRKLKASGSPNPPRSNFYRTQANRIRLIASLERRLAALKRKLGRG